MAKGWKGWRILTGGLVGLVAWLPAASAQGPGYQPLAPMPNAPAIGPGGPAPSMPMFGANPAPPAPPVNSQSFDYHGVPNGFSDEEYYPEPDMFWFKFKAEYLLWTVANPRLSTTVATTSNSPNLTNGVGALGDPGTAVLLGPGSYDYNRISGGRVTAGFAPGWFLPFEVTGFWLSSSTNLLNLSSDGSNNSLVLARPFQAPNLGSLNGLGEQVVLSGGFPGNLAGSINVAATITLWGIETNFFYNLCSSDLGSVDVIVGYRYADLSETLNLSNSVQSINSGVNISFNSVNTGGLPPGFISTAADSFATHNYFNGGTLGVRPTFHLGRLSVETDLKLSIGATHQILNVGGTSTLGSPDGSIQSVPGGLLAVASNSGAFTRDVFTIIPELGVNVGFQLTRNVKLFAGYNLFFWSNVVRPGDQLNNTVDSRQVPTDPSFDPTATVTQPGPSFVTRSFWGQGVAVGLEIGF
jgi:hypothetical protein